MKIHNTSEILEHLKNCIETKKSFSLLRMGDGGLKYIVSLLMMDKPQLKDICKKEGIPLKLAEDILTLWTSSINICDYIDSPKIYFEGNFWPRTSSDKTKKLLLNWKTIYDCANFTNENYCNPEVNFLMCLTSQKPSLLDIIKDKKVCCISNYSSLINVITNCDLEILQIPGFHENQYTHFSSVLDFINKHANDYDLWLVSAGELGRIFPGFIKFKGGRALDIGSLVDYWCTEKVPVRLRPYMYSARGNKLKLTLNKEGKKYKDFL